MKNSMIEVRNIHKTYKKRRSKEVITAVENVSFAVRSGEIIGLLGPNGAGKTSIIKIICGLLLPDSGFIKIDGSDNQSNRLRSLSKISAVLEGNRNIYWRLTVRENLEYFAGNRGLSRHDVAKRIDRLLIEFNLKDKEKELVNRLSRGMQQKLAIAVAILADTDVILLDEPTLGLDVEASYEIRELLRNISRKEHRTIIISSHDMGVVQDLCERVIIINNGKMVTDDRVENLLRLFAIRSYTLTIGDYLTNEQCLLLKERYPTHVYHKEKEQAIIEIDLPNSDEIYELFNILKRNHTLVESIDKKTVNFEQIFMKIVKGDNANAVD